MPIFHRTEFGLDSRVRRSSNGPNSSCGCSGVGGSTPQRDYRTALVPPSGTSAAKWCLNGKLEQEVRRGGLSRSGAHAMLDAMPLGSVIYGSKESVRAPTHRSRVLSYRTRSCSAAEERTIAGGVAFIKNHLSDLPVDRNCVPNTDDLCNSSGNGKCFGGNTSLGARKLVADTLDASNFRIRCYSACGSDPIAFTRCFQWRQPNMDIHICSDILSGAAAWTNAELACVIAHEILHVWGADEAAAFAMVQVTTGWGCP